MKGIHLLYCGVATLLLAALLWGISIHYDNVSAKVLGSGGNELSFEQIAAGVDHTCAIASDDKAYCWGDGVDGNLGDGSTIGRTSPVAVAQGAMPAGATIQQIAAGSDVSCAIASDGNAYCWGDGASSRLGSGSSTDQLTPVAVSQGAMPIGATIQQIAAGNTHVCVVASDDKAYCWGEGADGRLGNGDIINQSTPVALSQGAMPIGATIQKIAAGMTHACAIASDGKAYCWGSGDKGQLGNGDIISQTTPVAVSQGAMPVGATFRDISIGQDMTCAIASDDKVYCWGWGSVNGHLGNGVAANQNTPVAVSQGAMPSGATIQEVSVGDRHTCVIASDNVTYCWGWGSDGRLGHGTASDRGTPAAVAQGAIPTGVTIQKVSAGADYTCVIASDSKAYCWGNNGDGQIGDSSSGTDRYTAVAVQSIFNGAALIYKQIDAGNTHTCAIASDNKAYCWGEGTNGRLGNGSTDSQSTPVAVAQGEMPAGVTIRHISASAAYTCAIASDNKAYCWGFGGNGRLGNGAATQQTTPVAVSQGAMPAGATIQQISAGENSACAIASDNKAYCWGYNSDGQLGNGSTSEQYAPVAVSQGVIPAGSTIRQISVGDAYACAIASDGKAYCWGYGGSNQLGNGSTSTRTTPFAVSQGSMPVGATVKQIAAWYDHTCLIASDNMAYCFGEGSNGQLGGGSTTDRSTPYAVSQGAMPAGSTVRQIVVNWDHTCAIASDNKAYCWGEGASGELGNNSISQQNSPVAVSQGAIPSGAAIRQVTAGGFHTCTIASDSKSYCWGNGGLGRLGNHSTSNQSTPVSVSPMYRQIAVSQSVYRAYGPSSTISPGSPFADTNITGTLGAIADEFRLRIGLTNLEADSLPAIDSVVTGGHHTCAIASDYKTYCWGQNDDGQLGNGNKVNQYTPVELLPGELPLGVTFRQLALGDDHSCGIASNYKAYCWGDYANGQLGIGAASSDEVAPVEVSLGEIPAGSTFLQITAGDDHTCAIASNHKAYCWGDGADSRMGNGSLSGDHPAPSAVIQGEMPAGATALEINTYSNHNCIIASDGKAYCWGRGTYGRLGNGLTTDQPAPVAVLQGAMPSGPLQKIIVGGIPQTCVVASDNKAYCWGRNATGSLGKGAWGDSLTPVVVVQGTMPAGATIAHFSAGNAHACAVATDRKVYCWGNNMNGQIGDGSLTGQNSPVSVSQGAMPAGTTIQQLSAGNESTCIVTDDKKVYCWGWGQSGRLGNNDTVNQTTPVAVHEGAMQQDSAIIESGQLNLSLQAAPLGGSATCSAVTAGWASVSSSSVMAWGSAPPSHGTTIGAFGSDPTAPTTAGYSYQSIVRSDAFTNNQTLGPQQTGLWDVVLDDRSSKSATDYCFRIVSNTSGTEIDAYDQYPRIQTAMGELSVQFVDTNGVPISGAATNTVFAPLITGPEMQPTSAMLADYASSKILRVHNSLSNSGWSVSLAATDGPTANWQSATDSYAYNDESWASGVLGVEADSMDVAADGHTPDGTPCSASTGVSPGAYATFSSTVSTATLFSGSPSAQFNCSWWLWDIELDQIVPALQSPGDYSLDMTVTIVAN